MSGKMEPKAMWKRREMRKAAVVVVAAAAAAAAAAALTAQSCRQPRFRHRRT